MSNDKRRPDATKSKLLSRRSLMKATATLAVAAAATRFPTPAIAQGMKKVRFTLPWLANGSLLYPYVARHLGYFKKRGLDVSISRGYGSVAAAQAIAAGEFDYGIVFAGGTILGAARGLPLVVMGTCAYDATMGMVLRDDSPIKEAKDLEGKQIGTVSTSAEAPYWPAYASRAKIDTSGITMVQMDARVIEQSVANKKVDAITTIGTSSIPVMLAMKQPCRFLPWNAAGVSLYAGQVVTTRANLAKDRELSQAITEAVLEGLGYALRDPEAGIDIFMKEVPELAITKGGRENARISQLMMHYTAMSKEAQTESVGYTDLGRASGMIDLVMEYGAPKDAKKPDVKDLFVNDFVGKVKLSEAEWKQVGKNVAEYATILG